MPTANTLLTKLPVEERPRERLLHAGGAALSDAELVAVLLRTGRPGLSAIEMGQELIAERGGLGGPERPRKGLYPCIDVKPPRNLAGICEFLPTADEVPRIPLANRIPPGLISFPPSGV